tara:strand:+ start:255 stop:962 length:708 start_codon:yes stop_codon:yes gene_type:complete
MEGFVVRNLLSREEVTDLMSLCNRDWERASSIDAKGTELSYDSSRITEMVGLNFHELGSIPSKIIKKANSIFNNKFYTNESISILKYDSRLGAKFDYHTDDINYKVYIDGNGNRITDPEEYFIINSRPRRKISITVALNNKCDYNGGDFKIQPDGEQNSFEYNAKNIDLNLGDAVLFDSRMYHGVTPVTEGIRYSAIIWLYHLEEFYDWWSTNDQIPSEGFDRFKRYYEKYDIPL